MKKTLVLISIVLFTGLAAVAQKAEVLYFKANLACCKAKACDALEKDVKAIVEKNFTKEKVVFTEVRLSDEANKALVEKHNAKSQTVVMVVKKRKSEKVIDLTELVQQYSRSIDKDAVEKEFVAKINEGLK
jgi:hypothetical protein